MFRLIKFILRLAVLLCVTALLLFSYARYVEPHLLRTPDIAVYSAHVQSQHKELSIVAFADTHFSEYYTVENFSKVVDKINNMNPDLVFFLGDLIDYYDEYDENIKDISETLNQISASYGKYAVFGNHDYGGGSENYYRDIMENGGFQVLVNESIDITDLGITIVGIDDVVIGYGDPTVASRCKVDSFNIVLSHAPDIITQMTDYDIDLMLSGHTHGGQVRIPYYSESYLPPYGQIYQRGIYHFQNARNTTLYVNSGLGTTFLPLRFLSLPELTKLSLTDNPETQTTDAD